MEHNLILTETTLGDGSPVYNVSIGMLRFSCVTLGDAVALLDKLDMAIQAHTNDTTQIIECQVHI